MSPNVINTEFQLRNSPGGTATVAEIEGEANTGTGVTLAAGKGGAGRGAGTMASAGVTMVATTEVPATAKVARITVDIVELQSFHL